ncbi:hypothetical protein N4684_02665 [Escherichia coli]|uniref:hypothetical protein n=1 Tax=Escherichia coli TaxID=562 RepID=UPI000D0B4EC9|nr:hypothetical protein [Escherichia coli]MCU6881203.1 hypothetical protein [Escherichia coli]MCU6963403.1 hypothetical protein [Escherichia coli]
MNIQSNINANSVIIIDGHHFKANESGMWNLTDIWKTLNLPRSKAPSEWRTKEAKRFSAVPQKMRSERVGSNQYIFADKQVTLRYAGWVSFEFEDMVYAAFEAILAMPEVAAVVVNKMVELGHIAEAEQLERLTNADRDYAHEQMSHWRVKTTNKQRYLAVLNGHLTLKQAKAQGLKGVWLKRCEDALFNTGGL